MNEQDSKSLAFPGLERVARRLHLIIRDALCASQAKRLDKVDDDAKNLERARTEWNKIMDTALSEIPKVGSIAAAHFGYALVKATLKRCLEIIDEQ